LVKPRPEEEYIEYQHAEAQWKIKHTEALRRGRGGAEEACRTTSGINGGKRTDSAIKTYELSLEVEHMGGEQQACVKTYRKRKPEISILEAHGPRS
jgi:hypothetical protein